MKNQEIFSLVDELPLFVTLKLKRSIIQDVAEPSSCVVGGEVASDGQGLVGGADGSVSARASPNGGVGGGENNLNVDESSSSSSGRTSPNINNVKVKNCSLTLNFAKTLNLIFADSDWLQCSHNLFVES